MPPHPPRAPGKAPGSERRDSPLLPSFTSFSSNCTPQLKAVPTPRSPLVGSPPADPVAGGSSPTTITRQHSLKSSACTSSRAVHLARTATVMCLPQSLKAHGKSFRGRVKQKSSHNLRSEGTYTACVRGQSVLDAQHWRHQRARRTVDCSTPTWAESPVMEEDQWFDHGWGVSSRIEEVGPEWTVFQWRYDSRFQLAPELVVGVEGQVTELRVPPEPLQQPPGAQQQQQPQGGTPRRRHLAALLHSAGKPLTHSRPPRWPRLRALRLAAQVPPPAEHSFQAEPPAASEEAALSLSGGTQSDSACGADPPSEAASVPSALPHPADPAGAAGALLSPAGAGRCWAAAGVLGGLSPAQAYRVRYRPWSADGRQLLRWRAVQLATPGALGVHRTTWCTSAAASVSFVRPSLLDAPWRRAALRALLCPALPLLVPRLTHWPRQLQVRPAGRGPQTLPVQGDAHSALITGLTPETAHTAAIRELSPVTALSSRWGQSRAFRTRGTLQVAVHPLGRPEQLQWGWGGRGGDPASDGVRGWLVAFIATGCDQVTNSTAGVEALQLMMQRHAACHGNAAAAPTLSACRAQAAGQTPGTESRQVSATFGDYDIPAESASTYQGQMLSRPGDVRTLRAYYNCFYYSDWQVGAEPRSLPLPELPPRAKLRVGLLPLSADGEWLVDDTCFGDFVAAQVHADSSSECSSGDSSGSAVLLSSIARGETLLMCSEDEERASSGREGSVLSRATFAESGPGGEPAGADAQATDSGLGLRQREVQTMANPAVQFRSGNVGETDVELRWGDEDEAAQPETGPIYYRIRLLRYKKKKPPERFFTEPANDPQAPVVPDVLDLEEGEAVELDELGHVIVDEADGSGTRMSRDDLTISQPHTPAHEAFASPRSSGAATIEVGGSRYQQDTLDPAAHGWSGGRMSLRSSDGRDCRQPSMFSDSAPGMMTTPRGETTLVEVRSGSSLPSYGRQVDSDRREILLRTEQKVYQLKHLAPNSRYVVKLTAYNISRGEWFNWTRPLQVTTLMVPFLEMSDLRGDRVVFRRELGLAAADGAYDARAAQRKKGGVASHFGSLQVRVTAETRADWRGLIQHQATEFSLDWWTPSPPGEEIMVHPPGTNLVAHQLVPNHRYTFCARLGLRSEGEWGAWSEPFLLSARLVHADVKGCTDDSFVIAWDRAFTVQRSGVADIRGYLSVRCVTNGVEKTVELSKGILRTGRYTVTGTGYEVFALRLLIIEMYEAGADGRARFRRLLDYLPRPAELRCQVMFVRRFELVLSRIGDDYAKMYIVHTEPKPREAQRRSSGAAPEDSVTAVLNQLVNNKLPRLPALERRSVDRMTAGEQLLCLSTLKHIRTQDRARAKAVTEAHVVELQFVVAKNGDEKEQDLVETKPDALMGAHIESLEPGTLYSVNVRVRLRSRQVTWWTSRSPTLYFWTQRRLSLYQISCTETAAEFRWHRACRITGEWDDEVGVDGLLVGIDEDEEAVVRAALSLDKQALALQQGQHAWTVETSRPAVKTPGARRPAIAPSGRDPLHENDFDSMYESGTRESIPVHPYLHRLYHLPLPYELSVTLDGGHGGRRIAVGTGQTYAAVDELQPSLRYTVSVRQMPASPASSDPGWSTPVVVHTPTDLRAWVRTLGESHLHFCVAKRVRLEREDWMHLGPPRVKRTPGEVQKKVKWVKSELEEDPLGLPLPGQQPRDAPEALPKESGQSVSLRASDSQSRDSSTVKKPSVLSSSTGSGERASTSRSGRKAKISPDMRASESIQQRPSERGTLFVEQSTRGSSVRPGTADLIAPVLAARHLASAWQVRVVNMSATAPGAERADAVRRTAFTREFDPNGDDSLDIAIDGLAAANEFEIRVRHGHGKRGAIQWGAWVALARCSTVSPPVLSVTDVTECTATVRWADRGRAEPVVPMVGTVRYARDHTSSVTWVYQLPDAAVGMWELRLYGATLKQGQPGADAVLHQMGALEGRLDTPAEGTSVRIPAHTTKRLFDSLIPDTIYKIKLRGLDSADTHSPWTPTARFLTLPRVDVRLRVVGSSFALLEASRKARSRATEEAVRKQGRKDRELAEARMQIEKEQQRLRHERSQFREKQEAYEREKERRAHQKGRRPSLDEYRLRLDHAREQIQKIEQRVQHLQAAYNQEELSHRSSNFRTADGKDKIFEVRVFESDRMEIGEDIPPTDATVIVEPVPDRPQVKVVRGLHPGVTYGAATRAQNPSARKGPSQAVRKRKEVLDAGEADVVPDDEAVAPWGMWSEILVLETIRPSETKIRTVTEDMVYLAFQRPDLPEHIRRDVRIACTFQLRVNLAPHPHLIDLEAQASRRDDVDFTPVKIPGLVSDTTYRIDKRSLVVGASILGAEGEAGSGSASIADVWGSWEHCVTFRTLPGRPAVPVLYESRKDWVSFWWGRQTDALKEQRSGRLFQSGSPRAPAKEKKEQEPREEVLARQGNQLCQAPLESMLALVAKAEKGSELEVPRTVTLAKSFEAMVWSQEIGKGGGLDSRAGSVDHSAVDDKQTPSRAASELAAEAEDAVADEDDGGSKESGDDRQTSGSEEQPKGKRRRKGRGKGGAKRAGRRGGKTGGQGGRRRGAGRQRSPPGGKRRKGRRRRGAALGSDGQGPAPGKARRCISQHFSKQTEILASAEDEESDLLPLPPPPPPPSPPTPADSSDEESDEDKFVSAARNVLRGALPYEEAIRRQERWVAFAYDDIEQQVDSAATYWEEEEAERQLSVVVLEHGADKDTDTLHDLHEAAVRAEDGATTDLSEFLRISAQSRADGHSSLYHTMIECAQNPAARLAAGSGALSAVGDPDAVLAQCSWTAIGRVTGNFCRLQLPPDTCVSDLLFRLRTLSGRCNDYYVRKAEDPSVPLSGSKTSAIIGWKQPHPPRSASRLEVVSVIHSAVRLRWQHSASVRDHNQLVYHIWVAPTHGASAGQWHEVLRVRGNTAELRNLAPNAYYRARVGVSSTFGASPVTSPVLFSTAVRATMDKRLSLRRLWFRAPAADADTLSLTSVPRGSEATTARMQRELRREAKEAESDGGSERGVGLHLTQLADEPVDNLFMPLAALSANYFRQPDVLGPGDWERPFPNPIELDAVPPPADSPFAVRLRGPGPCERDGPQRHGTLQRQREATLRVLLPNAGRITVRSAFGGAAREDAPAAGRADQEDRGAESAAVQDRVKQLLQKHKETIAAKLASLGVDSPRRKAEEEDDEPYTGPPLRPALHRTKKPEKPILKKASTVLAKAVERERKEREQAEAGEATPRSPKRRESFFATSGELRLEDVPDGARRVSTSPVPLGVSQSFRRSSSFKGFADMPAGALAALAARSKGAPGPRQGSSSGGLPRSGSAGGRRDLVQAPVRPGGKPRRIRFKLPSPDDDGEDPVATLSPPMHTAGMDLPGISLEPATEVAPPMVSPSLEQSGMQLSASILSASESDGFSSGVGEEQPSVSSDSSSSDEPPLLTMAQGMPLTAADKVYEADIETAPDRLGAARWHHASERPDAVPPPQPRQRPGSARPSALQRMRLATAVRLEPSRRLCRRQQPAEMAPCRPQGERTLDQASDVSSAETAALSPRAREEMLGEPPASPQRPPRAPARFAVAPPTAAEACSLDTSPGRGGTPAAAAPHRPRSADFGAPAPPDRPRTATPPCGRRPQSPFVRSGGRPSSPALPPDYEGAPISHLAIADAAKAAAAQKEQRRLAVPVPPPYPAGSLASPISLGRQRRDAFLEALKTARAPKSLVAKMMKGRQWRTTAAAPGAGFNLDHFPAVPSDIPGDWNDAFVAFSGEGTAGLADSPATEVESPRAQAAPGSPLYLKQPVAKGIPEEWGLPPTPPPVALSPTAGRILHRHRASAVPVPVPSGSRDTASSEQPQSPPQPQPQTPVGDIPGVQVEAPPDPADSAAAPPGVPRTPPARASPTGSIGSSQPSGFLQPPPQHSYVPQQQEEEEPREPTAAQPGVAPDGESSVAEESEESEGADRARRKGPQRRGRSGGKRKPAPKRGKGKRGGR
eukprot:TRINITY_DN4855_c0_g2_i1.p1 TRINITY_DN4855_c0_g2~~TRINITY_DN4855_c0_g2_i1.p1  ORF type:complete len:4027 (+),score=899.48 TRINITY_DN4855_c0_g2_i1:77-12082(+)